MLRVDKRARSQQDGRHQRDRGDEWVFYWSGLMPARGEGVEWVEKWKIINHSHILVRGSRHGRSSNSLIFEESAANTQRSFSERRDAPVHAAPSSPLLTGDALCSSGGGASPRLLLPADVSVFECISSLS